MMILSKFSIHDIPYYCGQISERWVMLVNQAHPKIQSRIQLGIEAAKAKMHRGEPFILEVNTF